MGLDFGTDSVRCLVADSAHGGEVASSVAEYPRWKSGKYCDAAQNRYRQHPLDYIEGMEQSVRATLDQIPHLADKIVALSVDTTASTVAAADAGGMPLALSPGFADDPDAMFLLWKDHTAIREAMEINELCRTWGGTDYTKYSGFNCSSEWFWSKILHVVRSSERVSRSAVTWVEHCDWIPALLTGCSHHASIIRSRCAAGHKALWHPEWGGLPAAGFLERLDSRLARYAGMYSRTCTADSPAGSLSAEWAQRLRLSTSVRVGAGSVDAHTGAVGGEIRPHCLVKVMGTSTCDMAVCSRAETGSRLIRGICGQVDGSIIPGMIGMEAGQAAFGDIYAWFSRILLWPVREILPALWPGDEAALRRLMSDMEAQIIPLLSAQAEQLPPDATAPVALDWLNGRRSPDSDQSLKGGISGLTLGATAPRLFRAWVEATAFGSRRISECYASQGIASEGIIALGGIASKSPFIMQVMCDVSGMPVHVVRSRQACALGAAMAASVVAGIHPSIARAQQMMGQGFEKTCYPNAQNRDQYDQLYRKYLQFGDFAEQVSDHGISTNILSR
jgi:L-ribulokinase